MRDEIDLRGKRFGKLLVLRTQGRRPNRTIQWLCQCDCGGTKLTSHATLRSGNAVSCGCRKVVHGGRYSPEYNTWCLIKKRCYYPKHEKWERYGGRGITVCDRWRYSFANFLADMGSKPSPEHSIDRYPDNDGNYEPGNCRWATAHEQQWNRTTDARPTSQAADCN